MSWPQVLRCTVSFGLFIMPSFAGFAQQGSKSTGKQLREFDVVSIRPSNAESKNNNITGLVNGYDLRNTPLIKLISIAYQVREDQVEGVPSWGKSDKFDVLARVTEVDANNTLSWPQRRAFLLAVLKERFGLRAHIAEASRPIYLLQAVAGSEKLHPGAHQTISDPTRIDASVLNGDIVVTDRFLRGNDVTIGLLAENLGLVLKRDVKNVTGYQGLYDISLRWVPMDAPAPDFESPDTQSQFFEALRSQLGLKLVSSTGNVKIVHVDGVAHPSTN